MCVLTSLRTGKFGRIMRWCSSKTQSGISTVLDSVVYCYVLLTILLFYSSPQLSYNTRSFFLLGVACLHPIISTYRTSSSIHLGVSRLRPSIPTSRSASPHYPGSYCVAISPRRLLLFYSREISAKVSLSFFSFGYWRHHDSLLHPPPSYPLYTAHTSNISHNVTHCATVSCRLPM